MTINKFKSLFKIEPKKLILKSLIILFFFSIFSVSTSTSQWAILYRDADSLVLLGANNIYNFEFAKAEEQFKQVQSKYPLHPAGYFLDAMVDWWRINLDPDLETYDKAFLKKIDKVIKVCDKILDTNSHDINALFFKGGAIGYRARLNTQRNDWFSAVQDAKEALEILQRCQQIAPFNHDIMLGTGIYNYFSNKFPEEYPLLKPLMVFLPKGDKRLGLFQLHAASRHARYASVEAQVALLQIYYSFENNSFEALKIAQELTSKYPQNAYFHRYLGRCYIRMGMSSDAETTWRDILMKSMKKQTGYNNITAREATYYVGVSMMNKREYEKALKFLQKSLEGSEVIDNKPSGFYISTLLKIGNIYDALNKRDKAINVYNKVLKVDEWNDSHKTAKKYISSPYKN
jgi:tetratricopeptide (TPR) repeat protein